MSDMIRALWPLASLILAYALAWPLCAAAIDYHLDGAGAARYALLCAAESALLTVGTIGIRRRI